MVKRFVGYTALFLGSLAVLLSSIMLLLVIIIPFIGESLSGERGITAMAIMDVGGISLNYYGNFIATMAVMLALGVVTASLGRYIVDFY